MCVGLDSSSPLATSCRPGALWGPSVPLQPFQYLSVHAVETFTHTEGLSFERLRKTAAPSVGGASWKACVRNSCVLLEAPLLYTEVSGRSLPASLNLSSVGVQDLSRAWAAAQNANSGGRKRLLAELKMKINLKNRSPLKK